MVIKKLLLVIFFNGMVIIGISARHYVVNISGFIL